MASLKLTFLPVVLNRNFWAEASKPRINCGLRKIGPRKPMWRSRVLSTEAIQAIHSLKLAKTPAKLADVFKGRISRLLKADLMDILSELQRQNEVQLALMVFNFLRKEVEYEQDPSLFSSMILTLGKNNMVEKAEELFSELKNGGLRPDTHAYTEMIGAYFKANMPDRAMHMYESMKASGCVPDKLTFTILIRNLENTGEKELSALVKDDCLKYVELPEKFLEEVERTYELNGDSAAGVQIHYPRSGSNGWKIGHNATAWPHREYDDANMRIRVVSLFLNTSFSRIHKIIDVEDFLNYLYST